jgi:hypothetical protein
MNTFHIYIVEYFLVLLYHHLPRSLHFKLISIYSVCIGNYFEAPISSSIKPKRSNYLSLFLFFSHVVCAVCVCVCVCVRVFMCGNGWVLLFYY